MKPRLNAIRSASLLVLAGMVAFNTGCGGGGTVDPRPPPPPPPPPPPANNAPTATATLPDQQLIVGQTVTVDVSGSFTDPDGDALSYAPMTSNSAVVSVGLSGTNLSVTGVQEGAAAVTVIATDPGGLSASVSFAANVTAPAPTTIHVTPDSATLGGIGRTVQLSAEVLDQIGRPILDPAVGWTSEDTLVVTVDSTGLVTAVGSGETTVTGTSGDLSDAARLSVVQTIASITISPASDTVAVGDTTRLVATAVDENGHAVANATFGWTSLNEAVASVDRMGLVRGVAEGNTTILATAGSVVGTAMITVLTPPPPPGTWRGLVVAPEDRCSAFDADDYEDSPGLEDRITERMGGRVYEPYTGRYFTNTGQTVVDHVVAKAEAHDSGMCGQSPEERQAFANDLANLVLATRTLRRHQKAARDAAEWLPEINECWFAGTIVEVRVKYGLTVDEAERDVLESILSSCESTDMVFLDYPWTTSVYESAPDIAWSRYDPPLVWKDQEVTGETDVRARMSYSCDAGGEIVSFELSHDPELDWTDQHGDTRFDEATIQYGSLSETEDQLVSWTANDPRVLRIPSEPGAPIFERIRLGEVDVVLLNLSSPSSTFQFPMGDVGVQVIGNLRQSNDCASSGGSGG